MNSCCSGKDCLQLFVERLLHSVLYSMKIHSQLQSVNLSFDLTGFPFATVVCPV